MSVLCKKLTMILTVSLTLALQGCAKPEPKKVGETYTDKRGYVVIPGKGKLVFEVGSYQRPLNCMKENDRKTSRLIIRKSGYVFPTAAECDQERNRLKFKTLQSLEKGNFEYILRPFEYLTSSELHLQHFIIFDDPDFDSGEDRIHSGAVSLSTNQEYASTLNPRAGDYTDWLVYSPSTKFFSLYLDHEPKKSAMDAEVFLISKSGKLEPKSKLYSGKVRSMTGNPGQKYAIRLQGEPGGLEQKYKITAKTTQNSPTRRITAMDAYVEVSGQITVVIASQNLRGVDPGTNLSVFEKRGSTVVSLGQCALPGTSPDVTYCVIKNPSNKPKGGMVFAKFETGEGE